MSQGTVKWFDKKIGFGFIESVEHEKDLFVHFSEIKMTGYKFLKPGWLVSFEIGNGPKGLVAKNVQILENVQIKKTNF